MNFETQFSDGWRLCFADVEDTVASLHSGTGSTQKWPLHASTAPVLPVWHCPLWTLQHHGTLWGRFAGIWDVTAAAGPSSILRVVPAAALCQPETVSSLAAATGLSPTQLNFDVAATVDGYFTLDVKMDVLGSNAGDDLQMWEATLTVITPATAAPTYRQTLCAFTTITQLQHHDVGVLLTVPTGTVNADARVRSCWGVHIAQRNGT